MKWRLGAILTQIRFLEVPMEEPLRVLDIGGGRGILREQVEENTAWTVDSTDLNSDALKRSASHRGRNLYYDVCEENPSLINSYDIILLMDVLEHVPNTQQFLKSTLAHLKPEGFLLVNVPAIQTLHSAYDKAMGHYRRYNKGTLKREFCGLDIEIIDLRYWGFSMLPLLISRKLILSMRTLPTEEIIRFGFKVRNKIINRLATTVGKIETTLFHSPFIGSSLLFAGKRK